MANFWDTAKSAIGSVWDLTHPVQSFAFKQAGAQRQQQDYFSELGSYADTLRKRASEAYAEAGERPTYEIPQSVRDSLAIMEELSRQKAPATADMPTLTEMPGVDQILDRVQSGQAGQIQAAKELGAGAGASIGAVNRIGGQYDDIVQNIGIENARFAAEQAEKKAYYDTDAAFRAAQWERGGKLGYADALNRFGQYEDQAFQLNQLDPYNIAMNRGDMFQFAGDKAYYDLLGTKTGLAQEQAQSSKDYLMQLANMGIKMAPLT
jgi:hypothetical protein